VFQHLGVGIGLAVLYVLAAKLGLTFASLHPSASPVWPPTGLALAALLVLSPSLWPAVFAGALVANLLTAGTLATSLGIAIGNTLEALIGAGLVTRFAGGAAAFDRAPDIFRFYALGGLLSPIVSATLGVASLGLGGLVRWADFTSVWATWWLGNAAGALVVAPFLLLWWRSPAPGALTSRPLEALGLLGTTVATGLAVFGGILPPGMRHLPVAFVCLPPLLWAAFRFGAREAATLIVALTAIAVAGTLHGTGPFALATANGSLLLLQAFMATVALTVLPLAAVVRQLVAALAEKGRLLSACEEARAAVRASEARLHGTVHAAMDAIISVDERQRIVVFNAAAEQMFRCPAGQAVGCPLDRFIPVRHREAHRRHIEDFGHRGATARRMGALGELAGLRADGEEFPLEAAISQAEIGGQKLFTVILRDITERKRGESQLHQALTRLHQAVADRETLLREVHHRTKNNLQMLCDMLYLEAELLPDDAGRDALEKSSSRVYAFARLHEQLHRSLQGGQVHFGDYLAGIVDGFRQAHGEVDIRLDLPADRLDLDLDRTLHVGLILNELVANAVKHAFPEGRRGEIVVGLRPGTERLELEIRDNGKRLPADLDVAHAKTLGLRIVQILAARLHATVEVENKSGAAFRLTIPLRGEALRDPL
jgi:PAS domain S-box-containing protein